MCTLSYYVYTRLKQHLLHYSQLQNTFTPTLPPSIGRGDRRGHESQPEGQLTSLLTSNPLHRPFPLPYHTRTMSTRPTSCTWTFNDQLFSPHPYYFDLFLTGTFGLPNSELSVDNLINPSTPNHSLSKFFRGHQSLRSKTSTGSDRKRQKRVRGTRDAQEEGRSHVGKPKRGEHVGVWV